MQEEGKIYEGEITLGFSTTTKDASEVVERRSVEAPDAAEADHMIAQMVEKSSRYHLWLSGQGHGRGSMNMRAGRKWNVPRAVAPL